tara:strand:- start:39 stop:1241 length:1203 start_codon:yes stop_codon:yes gene_type:complete
MSKSLDIWEDDLETLAQSTQREYRRNLNKFLEFLGIDHEGLYLIHIEALKSNDPRDRGQVKRLLVKYQRKMRDEGYSSSSIDMVKKAVKRFFEANEIDFSAKKNGIKLRVNPIGKATRSHVKVMLELSRELRDKVLIHVLKDSGLRIGDALRLKVKDLTENRDRDDFLCVNILQEKTENKAQPCFGFETTQAVDRWLNYREREILPFKSNDYLFISTDTRHPSYGKPLNKNAGIAIFQRLRSRGKAQRPNLDWTKISAHSLRKYNTSRLENSDMKSIIIARMQGRRIKDSREHYATFSNKEILKAYKKHYKAIAITQPEFEDLEERLEKTESLLSHYAERSSQKERRAKWDDRIEITAKGTPTGIVSDVVYDVDGIAENMPKADMIKLIMAFQKRLEAEE